MAFLKEPKEYKTSSEGGAEETISGLDEAAPLFSAESRLNLSILFFHFPCTRVLVAGDGEDDALEQAVEGQGGESPCRLGWRGFWREKKKTANVLLEFSFLFYQTQHGS